MIQQSLIKMKARKDFDGVRMVFDKAIIDAYNNSKEIRKILVSPNIYWVCFYSENTKYKGIPVEQTNLLTDEHIAVVYK